jgi:hypothetical protein
MMFNVVRPGEAMSARTDSELMAIVSGYEWRKIKALRVGAEVSFPRGPNSNPHREHLHVKRES